MYYREEWSPSRSQETNLADLQHLTRQHEFITGMYVQAKLNMRSLLDQVFPNYTSVFYHLYCKASLRVLSSCLSENWSSERNTGEIEERIGEGVCNSKSASWIRDKAERLALELDRNPIKETSIGQLVALQSIISLVLHFQEQLELLEERIKDIAESIPAVDLVKSMPGIGDKLAASIIAEIGDAKQFSNAKQLVAFAGLDPSVYSSGKFVATSSRITKRGSKRLRRALYLAVQCGIRGSRNPRIREYFDKKRGEGKPYKVVVIACANKLLHHIYAMLTRGQPYNG
nr:IS110 family transposase [Paenibacillus alvei]